LSISDLVSSLVKLNKCEEEKERIQKEIGSITKNLQRAKQSQQFPSVIALFQQQLDTAKDELANHVKSIAQYRSLSNKAQDSFNSTLSQFKPQPQLEKMPERVDNLESTIKGMGQGPGPTGSGDNPMKGDTEIGGVKRDMRSRDKDIAELRGKLDKVEHALEHPNGLKEALEYVGRIANSVNVQSKRSGRFMNQISSLEDEVKAAGKNLDDRFAAIKKLVDTVEKELEDSNQRLDTNISDLGSKLKSTNELVESKLSSIESDIRTLDTQRHNLSNSTSTQISQVETDFEAQRRQATEKITAQEDLLASLKTQRQSLDNGGRLSSEATQTPHSAVLTRVVSLENRVQKHADLLNNITNIHKEVDVIRVKELTDLRQAQDSSQKSLQATQDDTLRKVEDLATKSEKMTNSQTTLSADFNHLRESLPGSLERLRNHLQSELDGFKTRLPPVSDLAQTVTKCESKIESISRGIRSLENRWNNITTGDLVNSMARAMQEMYPSVDQLSQQLTAYRSETEARISALKSGTDAFKADTEMLKTYTNQLKADTQKAQADAQKAQASAEMPRAPQVSPEQLQTLTQLPTLLQQVKDFSDKLGPIERAIEVHSDKLQKNLEVRIDLQNKVEAQDDAIGGISSNAEDQNAVLKTIKESTDQIGPLINRVDEHISQLKAAQRTIDELTGTAAEGNPTASGTLDAIRIRLKTLEDGSKTEGNDRADLRTQLRSLKEDRDLDALRAKLKVLEDRKEAEDKNFTELQEQVDALEKREPPVSLEKFTEQGVEVKMYIKRLRKAEDTFKALGKGLGKGESIVEILAKWAKEEEEEKKEKEGIDGQETPQPQSNGRAAFTPRPTATPKTVPTGPTLGAYQAVELNVKGHAGNPTPSVSQSNHTAMQVQQPSQTPSGPSSSHPSPYGGKSAEPRQVQHLKGKRRVSSVTDSEDERSTAESSSVGESSPAPSSGPSSFTPGSSRKDKKKAKKRAEWAEENSHASNRPGKKRKRSKLENE
jgi:ABC-type transporter Mla subunit MlaD